MDFELPIFDSHADYDSYRYEGQGPELVSKLIENGIDRIVTPAISYQSNHDMREMYSDEKFNGHVFYAAGIHPHESCHLSDRKFWTKEQKKDFDNLLQDPGTVAVKTGIELSRDNMPDNEIQNQKDCMCRLIDKANEYELPVVLHIRDAADEALCLLREKKIENAAVCHCYVYGPEVTDKLMRLSESGTDMYFGIGGKITLDESEDLRASLLARDENGDYLIPMERVLLETDSPYVRPKGYEGKNNTSYTLVQVAETLATLRGVSVSDVIRQTYENAMAFYRIKI